VRWFLDADDNIDSDQNLKLLFFGPFTMFLEHCLQIHCLAFALRRQINKQKVCENYNLLCAGNIVFVKYQAQGFF